MSLICFFIINFVVMFYGYPNIISVIVVIWSPSFIIIVKCRMLRCLVSMEYLRATHRILMRKSRFSSRRSEDNFSGDFREIDVKFES